MYKKLIKIFSFLGNSGMAGQRLDNIDAYRKDMYKFEREGVMEEEMMHPKIFKVVSGKKVFGAGTKDTQKLRAGALTRHTAEGQNIIFKSPIQGWTTYANYWTYSDGLIFSPEAIEDTVKLKNALNDYARTWGVEVRIAKETITSRIFNNGGNLTGDWVFNGSYEGETDPSGDLLYDSKPLWNLSGNLRTTKAVNTYYNSIATAYPSSGPILGSHFESVYNLMTATNNRDELGAVIRNKPDTVLTQVGADHLAMKRVLLSERLAGGELNDVNIYQGLVKNIYDWDYLTDSAFYIGKAQHESFQFHERLAPAIRFFRHEDTAGYKASIRTRFGPYMKVGSWRCWARGGGSSS